MLKISVRWVREKMKRYQFEGDGGLIHKSRGKKSSKRWNESEKAIALDLIKSGWHGFGPTFAAEKLRMLKGILVSDETIRKAMIADGIWIPGKRKIKHRAWPERKKMLGIINAKFATAAANDGDSHRSIDGFDLYDLFCSQEQRVVSNDYTIRYRKKILQLEKDQPAIVRPKTLLPFVSILMEKYPYRLEIGN